VGVAINSVIAATFSEEMDASTITTSAFYLSGGVTGTVSYGTNTATFTPYSNLSNATTYTATITTGVKDVAGNNMAANYTWSFTTVISAPPKVTTGVATNIKKNFGKIAWNGKSYGADNVRLV